MTWRLWLAKWGRGDAAIDENGQVIVVFSAQIAGLENSVTLGRRFDASGNRMGGTFYLSEKEVPNLSTPPLASANPRVPWRDGNVAVIGRATVTRMHVSRRWWPRGTFRPLSLSPPYRA
jgi:hypothetical protein